MLFLIGLLVRAAYKISNVLYKHPSTVADQAILLKLTDELSREIMAPRWVTMSYPDSASWSYSRGSNQDMKQTSSSVCTRHKSMTLNNHNTLRQYLTNSITIYLGQLSYYVNLIIISRECKISPGSQFAWRVYLTIILKEPRVVWNYLNLLKYNKVNLNSLTLFSNSSVVIQFAWIFIVTDSTNEGMRWYVTSSFIWWSLMELSILNPTLIIGCRLWLLRIISI